MLLGGFQVVQVQQMKQLQIISGLETFDAI